MRNIFKYIDLNIYNCHMKKFIIQAYLIFHQFYHYLWYLLFNYLESIVFIYYLNDNKVKNITLNYYLKYNLDEFDKGTYYTKIYNKHGTHHIAFDGKITHINKIKLEPNEYHPKRKQLFLSDNGNPINIDLDILDNYKINMKQFNNCVKNLGLILIMMGIKCSHVTIIQMIPFNRITLPVNEVEIEHLYQLDNLN